MNRNLNNNQPKKKGFRLFDSQREGKGVEKGEDTTPNLKRFFKLWGRKFWRLISVNLLILVQILPVVIGLYLYIAGPKVATQQSPLYPTLLGAQTALPTSAGMTLLSQAAGLLHQYPIFNSWANWVIAGLAIFQIVTYGWQKVATTYILRNMVRGDGVFLISDYFYAIRRNRKQGFLIGLFDCVAIVALIGDFMFFYSQPTTGLNNFMYAVIIALVIIYGIMRFYIYLMAVTFDMKFRKILKNALIFTVLGIRRNLMAILGMAALIGLSVALIILLVPIKFYAIILIPFLCVFGFSGFMYTFAAYPIIEKYMIAPVKQPVVAEADNADVQEN